MLGQFLFQRDSVLTWRREKLLFLLEVGIMSVKGVKTNKCCSQKSSGSAVLGVDHELLWEVRKIDLYIIGHPSALSRGDSLQYRRSQLEQKFGMQHKSSAEPLSKQRRNGPSLQSRRSLQLHDRTGNISNLHTAMKLSRVNSVSAPSGEPEDDSRGSWNGKATCASKHSNHCAKMSDIIQRRCKNVVTRLQKKMIKEGPQIVPMLADLWRRLENPSYYGLGGSNNLLGLRKIEQRVDGLVYSEVMDLVCDVQMLLKNSVQYYGFSYEVRIEARKVHDLFFDILKIAFPEADFREARNAVSFRCPISSASASCNEVECETNTPPLLLAHKESRLGGNVPSRDNDESLHPGELVVCKKRRNGREKARTRPVGPVSPPPSTGKSLLGRPSSIWAQRGGWGNQPITGSCWGVGVGRPKPVKRSRTDVGKRTKKD